MVTNVITRPNMCTRHNVNTALIAAPRINYVPRAIKAKMLGMIEAKILQIFEDLVIVPRAVEAKMLEDTLDLYGFTGSI